MIIWTNYSLPSPNQQTWWDTKSLDNDLIIQRQIDQHLPDQAFKF